MIKYILLAIVCCVILMGIFGCANKNSIPVEMYGIYDCSCNGKRVECPNYIPESWDKYCKGVK